MDRDEAEKLWTKIRSKHGGLTQDSSQQQTNSNAGTSSIFGSGSTQQNTQPSQSGGLFGTTTQKSQAQPTGGLFGTSTAPTSNPGTNSIFGSSNTQQNNGQGTSSLFGGNTNSNNIQPNPQQSTGGLFGNIASNAQQTSQHPSGSGFGGNSLFGGTGGLSGHANSSTTQNMFSKPLNQNPAGSSSLFGMGSVRPGAQLSQPSAPSLLGATQHAQVNNSAPFGRLSMGQSNTGSTNTVGAVKVNLDSLRPTTRFEDCIDSVKQELELVDKMIQQQEGYCRQIEAFLPKHEENIGSISPDVDFIKNKAEDTEQALAMDAQGVDTQRKNSEKDRKDIERCQRIVTNLGLPQMYQYSSMSGLGSMYNAQQRPQPASTATEGEKNGSYDTDLVGKYFIPMAAELQQMVGAYTNNLSEIESHIRVIEGSAVTQAQQLARRKAGMNTAGGQPSKDDTVRELAETLRGFEQSILGTASVVGQCRDGVNDLSMGRLGSQLGYRS